MADRGTLFSAPMVRALLAGRKTQTRRLCVWANNPNSPALSYIVACDEPGWFGDEEGEVQFKVPYAAGDRLWVREAWRTIRTLDRFPPRELPHGTRIWHEADRDNCDAHGRLRPGRFMPRWASRLTLTVTDVRVQRLQAISEADAIAEGIEARGFGSMWGWIGYDEPNPHMTRHYSDPRESYRTLWSSLHNTAGERWDDDPWIVALTFDVRTGNIDAEARHG